MCVVLLNEVVGCNVRGDVVAGVRANMKIIVIPLRELGGLYNVRASITSVVSAAVFNC